MKTDLYVHIPKPCHENWDNMTTVDKGKFCSSCNKEVVDFSRLTDVEVLNFFKRSTGNTCGRFNTDQLQRPLQETKIEKKKGWKWIIAGITSMIITSKSNAQKKDSSIAVAGKVKIEQSFFKPGLECGLVTATGQVQTLLPVPPEANNICVLGGAILMQKIIKGYVVDEDNNPVTGATAFIDNNDMAHTDKNGYFEIRLIGSQSLRDHSVTFKAFRFMDEKITIEQKDEKEKKICMKMERKELPGVTVISYGTGKHCLLTGGAVGYKKISKKDTIIAAARKIIDTCFKTGASFKIFPNPVQRNSIIHISINEPGNYYVQLFDNASRLVHAEENVVSFKEQPFSLQLPGNTVAGIYYIKYINQQTKKYYVDKLIIQ